MFSLSPTSYETTGSGFLIAEDRVANRILLEGRMARLVPGAAEASGTDWLYAATRHSLAGRPTIVRSRFSKMLAEGMLVKRFTAGPRELFEFAADTSDLDQGIEKYWAPKVISQAHSDWDGDGKTDLLFFNRKDKVITLGEQRISLAGALDSGAEFPLVFLARFPGDERADLLVGRMSDAIYGRGETLSALFRQYPFQWQRLDSRVNHWQKSYQYWFWSVPIDVPLVADHDRDGFDSQLAYRPKTGQWYLFPNQLIDGPSLPASASPLPVVGRFLPGSSGDLAVWSPINGQFKVKSLDRDDTASNGMGRSERGYPVARRLRWRWLRRGRYLATAVEHLVGSQYAVWTQSSVHLRYSVGHSPAGRLRRRRTNGSRLLGAETAQDSCVFRLRSIVRPERSRCHPTQFLFSFTCTDRRSLAAHESGYKPRQESNDRNFKIKTVSPAYP